MATQQTIHTRVLRVFLITLVGLFAIPAATLFFARYALDAEDAAFLARVDERLAADTQMSSVDKAEESRFYRGHLLSTACDATEPQDQKFHDQVCGGYASMHWQFHWAERIARWTLVFGAALLASALVLGGLAFVNRGLRYASFVVGWRLMTLSSAAEVLAQGVMCVWLSFWLTAYFTQRYYQKLVVVVAMVAAWAVIYALVAIFKKRRSSNEIEGELVTEADAPRLWERVRHLAARVKTAPPDHIVAGIDTNFFVTEAPRSVDGRSLSGRTLFVSLPLLRILETSEADAVLAHELAHLGGGDTRSSAALGPKLSQFDQYTREMATGGLTLIAHYLLRLYRMIFEFALARDSREREHLADRTAAALVAPRAIVRSLIKISAYASYRDQIERKLFAHDRQHDGELGIAGFVADGLHPYAASSEFIDTMKTADVPHPYDSHPPLVERMRNVGHEVPESDYGAIFSTEPRASWATDISTAIAIERRLWGVYEQRFVAQHERALAYRYEPTTEQEQAVVLRYFPAQLFALGQDRQVEVTYAGLNPHVGKASEPISWDEVKGLTFKQGQFGSLSLIVTHHDKGLIGARTTKISLRGLGKRVGEFKAVVGGYWQRHQVMRAHQKQQV